MDRSRVPHEGGWRAARSASTSKSRPGSTGCGPVRPRSVPMCGRTTPAPRSSTPASTRPAARRAGLLIGEICMGGFGQVALRSAAADGWPTWVEVRSSQPVLACLASQYGRWSLAASKEETGGKKFFSLELRAGARAGLARRRCTTNWGTRDRAERGVLVLEVDRAPPAVVVNKVLRDCGLAPAALTLVLTPTNQPRRHYAGRRARAGGGAATRRTPWASSWHTSSMASASRRCPRRTRRRAGDGAHQTMRSSTAGACICRCAAATRRRAISRRSCRRATRATTGDRSPTSFRVRVTTSTRSTRRCSRRRRCG